MKKQTVLSIIACVCFVLFLILIVLITNNEIMDIMYDKFMFLERSHAVIALIVLALTAVVCHYIQIRIRFSEWDERCDEDCAKAQEAQLEISPNAVDQYMKRSAFLLMVMVKCFLLVFFNRLGCLPIMLYIFLTFIAFIFIYHRPDSLKKLFELCSPPLIIYFIIRLLVFLASKSGNADNGVDKWVVLIPFAIFCIPLVINDIVVIIRYLVFRNKTASVGITLSSLRYKAKGIIESNTKS